MIMPGTGSLGFLGGQEIAFYRAGIALVISVNQKTGKRSNVTTY